MIRAGFRSSKVAARTCRRTLASDAAPASNPETPPPSSETSVGRDLADILGIPGDRIQSRRNASGQGPMSSRNRQSDLLPPRPKVEQGQMDEFKSQNQYSKYHLHCLTSHSNTLLTLTDYKHEPIMWTSAGLCGFKKAARGGYEAGFRSTTMMLEKMKLKEDQDAALELKSRTEPQRVQKTQASKRKPIFRPAQIELVIKDFGLGREAVMKALMGVEGDHYRARITNIVDATPLKFGGVRARAVRRL